MAYHRPSEWSRSHQSSNEDQIGVVEIAKLALLFVLFAACAASWFVDPMAPTNSGPAGYLGLPMDFGIKIREIHCSSVETSLKACRKARPAPKDEPQGWLDEVAAKGETRSEHGGWGDLFRKAGQMAEDREKGSSQSSGCEPEASRAEICRQASRSARERVQLECIGEVTAHWECAQSTEGQSGGSCPKEMAAVHDCANLIIGREMRHFPPAKRAP